MSIYKNIEKMKKFHKNPIDEGKNKGYFFCGRENCFEKCEMQAKRPLESGRRRLTVLCPKACFSQSGTGLKKITGLFRQGRPA